RRPRRGLQPVAGCRHAGTSDRHLGGRGLPRRLGRHVLGRPLGRQSHRGSARRLARVPRRWPEALTESRMTLRRMMLLTAAILLPASAALAGPDGPAVVGGNATVVNPGTANVTVNQFSDRAIINWRLFDVGAGERVQFNQPGASSIILN